MTLRVTSIEDARGIETLMKGILLHEPIEQRLNLCAGGVEHDGAFMTGAFLEQLLSIGVGAVGDLAHRARRRQRGERGQAECQP